MNNSKKKAAVRAGTPTAATSRKTFSINRILQNGGDVKVLIKKPGDIPRLIPAEKIPQAFVSKRLRLSQFEEGGPFVIYDPKSTAPINVAFGVFGVGFVYRGTIIVANFTLRRLKPLSTKDIDTSVVWLMNHSV